MLNHSTDFLNLKLNTLRELIDFSCSFHPEDIAFSYKNNEGVLIEESYSLLLSEIQAMSAFLKSEDYEGKHIALVGGNSIEWIVSFFSVTCAGGVIVPIDKDLSAEEINDTVCRSDCRCIIYEDDYSPKFAAFDTDRDIRLISFSDIRDIISRTEPKPFSSVAPSADDTAAIVYTSGTTGKMKGVVLSHKNLISDALAGCRHMTNLHSMMMILPLHHTFGLCTSLLEPIIEHVPVYICKNLRRIASDLASVKPDVISIVPAVADLIYKKIISQAKNQGKDITHLIPILESGISLKIGIEKRRKLYTEVIESLGGNLRTIICGGAPINIKTANAISSFGIDFFNGYGITECSPIVSVNPYWKNKLSTVGPALPCCEIKIKDPDKSGIGEIAVKGDNVFKGYYKDEQETMNSFDGEWFLTGDLGKLDNDRFLSITGRKKNLIILSNGKNISPEDIEAKLTESNFISEAIVSAKDDHLHAELYVPDCSDEVKAQISTFIKKFNRKNAAYKNINSFEIRSEPFSKTSTLKIKR